MPPVMPFDHLIIVMMENHSFDNLLGDLGRTRDDVNGLTFAGGQTPTNHNPGVKGVPPVVYSQPVENTAQPKGVTQRWTETHAQINGGAMDGFVRTSGVAAMGYYRPAVLPFAYSMADQFTLANRWFSSVPGPTYPNRRFLLAGTAYGTTRTSVLQLLEDREPPRGTICDRLSEHNVSWCNYFTDVPMTFVIPSIIYKHPGHFAPLAKFFDDLTAGTLPAVSFVDPGIGVVGGLLSDLAHVPKLKSALEGVGAHVPPPPEAPKAGQSRIDPPETEEAPQDMYWGELWAAKLVQAVLDSRNWLPTLLVYTYDEHGGYYDHEAPPEAPPPDDIRADEPPGSYAMYGPRVPAIVVSPYSQPRTVTNTVHDHASILATIEARWAIPPLTARDGSAHHVMDFLNLDKPARERLHIEFPKDTGPSGPAPSASVAGA